MIKLEQRIAKSIKQIDYYYGLIGEQNIQELKKKPLEYHGFTMSVFQIINYTIQIGEDFLLLRYNEYPETYGEVFTELNKKEIITNELETNIKQLVRYRNLIAHEYHKLSEEELEEIIGLLETVNEFLEIIGKNVK